MSYRLLASVFFKYLLVFYIPFWLIPSMGAAQDKVFNNSQFTKIASLEGLRVKCILQDKQGFHWLGTETGLYRYDGYHTELINTTSIGISLSADLVLSLYEDRQANLWIGTSNGLQQLSSDRKSIINSRAARTSTACNPCVASIFTRTRLIPLPCWVIVEPWRFWR
jgi:hypothetical protein